MRDSLVVGKLQSDLQLVQKQKDRDVQKRRRTDGETEIFQKNLEMVQKVVLRMMNDVTVQPVSLTTVVTTVTKHPSTSQ